MSYRAPLSKYEGAASLSLLRLGIFSRDVSIVERFPRVVCSPSDATDRMTMSAASFETHAGCGSSLWAALYSRLFWMLICWFQHRLPPTKIFVLLFRDIALSFFPLPPCVSTWLRLGVCFLFSELFMYLFVVLPLISFYLFIFVLFHYSLLSIKVTGVCTSCLSYPGRWHSIALSNRLASTALRFTINISRSQFVTTELVRISL